MFNLLMTDIIMDQGSAYFAVFYYGYFRTFVQLFPSCLIKTVTLACLKHDWLSAAKYITQIPELLKRHDIKFRQFVKVMPPQMMRQLKKHMNPVDYHYIQYETYHRHNDYEHVCRHDEPHMRQLIHDLDVDYINMTHRLPRGEREFCPYALYLIDEAIKIESDQLPKLIEVYNEYVENTEDLIEWTLQYKLDHVFKILHNKTAAHRLMLAAVTSDYNLAKKVIFKASKELQNTSMSVWDIVHYSRSHQIQNLVYIRPDLLLPEL